MRGNDGWYQIVALKGLKEAMLIDTAPLPIITAKSPRQAPRG
jgi:hypothetical protein